MANVSDNGKCEYQWKMYIAMANVSGNGKCKWQKQMSTSSIGKEIIIKYLAW
jgi:hypothetical protein